jgi:exopolysaccharide production protein ExoQ
MISHTDVRVKFTRLISVSRSREALGPAWVAFFFTLYNVSVLGVIAPLAIMLGFASCCVLYYREIYYYLVNNKKVAFYPILVLVSSAWSSVPSLSLWYGFQLIVTVATGFFMGIVATPRQIVHGVFIAAALIIIASVISGRKGVAATGYVLLGLRDQSQLLHWSECCLLAPG